MFKRPHYIALGLVGLLTLVLLNLPHQTASQIKLAIGSLFLPLFGLSKSTQQLVSEAGDALTPRSELIKKNEELRLANRQWQLRSAQVEAVMHENDQLRQMVGWQRQSPWKVKAAKVIARDPANWWQVVQIDLGSRDGLKTDMPVLAPTGCLIGRISAVSLTRAQVALIGNSNCRVGAKVNDKESGVITGGAGPLNSTLVTLSYLSSGSTLKPGQAVKTSGVSGGVYPAGISIGQVAENPRPVEFGLYMEARVKLAADLNSIDEVWVMVQP
jgi:rod shape-determining protein MreC